MSFDIYGLDDAIDSIYETIKELHEAFSSDELNTSVDKIIDDAFEQTDSGVLEYEDGELKIVVFGPEKLADAGDIHTATISIGRIFQAASDTLYRADELDGIRAESLREAAKYLIEQADKIDRLSA